MKKINKRKLIKYIVCLSLTIIVSFTLVVSSCCCASFSNYNEFDLYTYNLDVDNSSYYCTYNYIDEYLFDDPSLPLNYYTYDHDITISNHNPSVKNTLLIVSPRNAKNYKGLREFDLKVKFTPRYFTIFKDDKFSVNAFITTNFSIYTDYLEASKPCDVLLDRVQVKLKCSSNHSECSQSISADYCGFKNFPSVPGCDIYCREIYSNFTCSEKPKCNELYISMIHFCFNVEPDSKASGWDYCPQLSLSFESDESLSWKGGIWVSIGDEDHYYPPTNDNLDKYLDVEGNLFDSVGGDIGKLSDKFSDVDDLYDNPHVLNGLDFLNYFFDVLMEVPLFSFLVELSLILGCAGFVLNLGSFISSKIRNNSNDDS